MLGPQGWVQVHTCLPMPSSLWCIPWHGKGSWHACYAKQRKNNQTAIMRAQQAPIASLLFWKQPRDLQSADRLFITLTVPGQAANPLPTNRYNWHHTEKLQRQMHRLCSGTLFFFPQISWNIGDSPSVLPAAYSKLHVFSLYFLF